MIKILKYGEVAPEEIFSRVEPVVDVTGIVTEIIGNVRKNGDKALYEYCEKFDKAKLTSLQVTKAEIDEAAASVGEDFLRILRTAADNIRKFVVSAGNAKRKKLPIPIGTGSFCFDNPTDYPPKSSK